MITLAVLAATTVLAGVAHASLFQQQQALLDQGCRTAVPLIKNMLNQAANTRIWSIQTQVQVLWPGNLTGDIVFNPSGPAVNAADDPRSISQQNFRCGHISSGNGRVGNRIPGRHVVAVVQDTVNSAGTYTLTLWLSQKGRRILAGLAAAERRYHRHHPRGHHPPTLTWGIGLHYTTSA